MKFTVEITSTALNELNDTRGNDPLLLICFALAKVADFQGADISVAPFDGSRKGFSIVAVKQPS